MFELGRNKILRNFEAVYAGGRSFVNRNLVLYVLRDENSGGKVGFAAGKKLGGAVIRNRARRLLRETFRLNQNKIRTDCALILVARKNLVGADLATAEKSFLELCRRAKILL